MISALYHLFYRLVFMMTATFLTLGLIAIGLIVVLGVGSFIFDANFRRKMISGK